jgi:hypothetical protein
MKPDLIRVKLAITENILLTCSSTLLVALMAMRSARGIAEALRKGC